MQSEEDVWADFAEYLGTLIAKYASELLADEEREAEENSSENNEEFNEEKEVDN